jgi:hypothetical protein
MPLIPASEMRALLKFNAKTYLSKICPTTFSIVASCRRRQCQTRADQAGAAAKCWWRGEEEGARRSQAAAKAAGLILKRWCRV